MSKLVKPLAILGTGIALSLASVSFAADEAAANSNSPFATQKTEQAYNLAAAQDQTANEASDDDAKKADADGKKADGSCKADADGKKADGSCKADK